MATPLSRPPINTQLTDKNGYLTPTWSRWFTWMFQRAGQGNADSNSQLQASVSGNTASISVLGQDTLSKGPTL